MDRRFKVAVVGATGAVGKQLLSILEERKFPVSELVPFASARSSGKSITYQGNSVQCRVLKPGCFAGVDIAFFDASDAVSQEWVPQAAQSGCWVIDNSASFRMDSDIPLVVPELNGSLVVEKAKRDASALGARDRILAGPNCSTVQLVMALKPLHDLFGLKRVVVSTYQSASGAGTLAVEELRSQTTGYLSGEESSPQAFQHQIAFNCIPQIGGFKHDGYTSEEQKIIQETRKILELSDLRISATAVRVPTFACHGESVNLEFLRPVDLEAAREALCRQPGIVLQDEPGAAVYPMGNPGRTTVEAAAGNDPVYVGRLRIDPSLPNGLNLWVVSDNLRKGAALNAVQIGEILVRAEI